MLERFKLVLLGLLGFSSLASFQISKGHILTNSDGEPVTKSCLLDLLAFETHNLRGEGPRVEVTLAELSIEIRSPGIEGSFLVNRCCKARLRLADLNVFEVDTVHADFLGSAEHSELACTPHDQLVQVSDRSRETTCSTVHYIVDLKLIQFQRSEEIVLNCLRVVSKSHLMTAILAKTIQSAPCS